MSCTIHEENKVYMDEALLHGYTIVGTEHQLPYL